MRQSIWAGIHKAITVNRHAIIWFLS